MTAHIGLIEAETHPPGYMLHKYWARKPHNILGAFLDQYASGRSLVIDPFCGSGVFLNEAAKRGHDAIGFDVNPTSVLISRVTTKPPDPEALREAVTEILGRVEREFEYLFCHNDKTVRYAVHEIVVDCDCGQEVSFSQSVRDGRRYVCAACGTRLSFNLENMTHSKVAKIVFEGKGGRSSDPVVLAEENSRSRESSVHAKDRFDFAFATNRRILAFEGLRTSHLFTARNFSVLTAIADEFHALEDTALRDAALLILTASVAQCSRLIPYRNDMSTGGPAWSVPGFWVPPQHLETNPFIHLRARLRKFIRGITDLRSSVGTGEVQVQCLDSRTKLTETARTGVRADFVFLDPPYGDSVPYSEFSAIWNSFLGIQPKLDEDISVSDRMAKQDSWARYTQGLNEIIAGVRAVLATSGVLLVTFNSHDKRAWSALLSALHKHGFYCEDVNFVVPAVVPSKAQFAPKNSYLGDFYAVFRRQSSYEYSRSLEPVVDALARCAASRRGLVAPNLARRVLFLTLLRENVSFTQVDNAEELLSALFATSGEYLRWIGRPLPAVPLIEQVSRDTVADQLHSGPQEWRHLVHAVAVDSESLGAPDPAELRALLGESIVMKGNRVLAISGSGSDQLSLLPPI